jgi:hypothetical protein
MKIEQKLDNSNKSYQTKKIIKNWNIFGIGEPKKMGNFFSVQKVMPNLTKGSK